jgi:hypothetical protein
MLRKTTPTKTKYKDLFPSKCSLGQTFEDLNPLGLLGIEFLRILEFFSNHAKLSALWSRGSWPDYSRMRSCAIWDFERWSSHASIPVYFRLSVWVVRCCSRLARPCKVFHSWDGKIGGALIDRSRDAQPEWGEMSEVVTSIGVRKCDQSHIVRLESTMQPKLRIQTESWYTSIISMYNG